MTTHRPRRALFALCMFWVVACLGGFTTAASPAAGAADSVADAGVDGARDGAAHPFDEPRTRNCAAAAG